MALAQQSRGGGVSLQTAALPAGTRLAAENQGSVPHFGAGAHIALVNLAIKHNTAAHAGAEGEQHCTFGALGSAGNDFAQRSAVGVIGKAHRNAQLLPQLIAERDIFPTEVAGVDHQPLRGAAIARRADTDRNAIRQRDARLFNGFLNAAGDIINDIIEHTVGTSLDGGACDDLLVFINHADRYIRSAKVNAYTIFHKSNLLVSFCP